MNEDYLFQVRTEAGNGSEKKPAHTASLVMGILSLVFSLLIPLLGEIFGVIGIVMSSRNRKEFSTTAALVCSIIGLVLALINHILGIMVTLSALAIL